MRNRREFLEAGLASFAAMAVRVPEGSAGFEDKIIYTQDLPPLNLRGWQATMRELSFPAGLASPKHRHSGFVLGYVLEGSFRFHFEGQPERVLSPGECFYEGPGAIHLPSGSASTLKPARVLVVGLGEKGKKFTIPL